MVINRKKCYTCLYRQLYIDDYSITCRYRQVLFDGINKMGDSNRKVFAERLKYAREKLRNLTQTQLAEITGLPSTSISHFEKTEGTRKPSFDNLRRLAKALDVTTDYLLGRSNDPIGNSINDELYRHVQLLTDEDRQFAQDMIKKMVERSEKKDK
jgi:transcriptional regulator with XRE-family HTH domain